MNAAPYNQGTGWSRIGTAGNPFKGTFDGRGHAIKNLYMNISDSSHQTDCEQGLFGSISGGGSVKNLWVENASVSAGRNTGILVGMLGNGTIENCSASRTIHGNGRIGGIVGSIQDSSAVVSGSFSTASVISPAVPNAAVMLAVWRVQYFMGELSETAMQQVLFPAAAV